MKIFATICFITICLFSANSQEISHINSTIKLDGIDDETVWLNQPTHTKFNQNFPTDSLTAQNQTEVKLLFDDENLFVFAKCYHQPNEKEFVQTLKRDFSIFENDAFALSFDPFGDGLNGFYFMVNAKGAQTEAMIGNGTDVATVWDNRWFSAVKKLLPAAI